MKNIALIIAGGVGARMQQNIPKQFLNVYDKPIFVYTLEAFQNHPQIDAIELVCLDGWQEVARAYAKQYGIAKLENIVPGGECGMMSIRNGLYDIHSRYNGEDDIVLIHDAIRPMVDERTITDNIRVCREKGNAVTAVPCTTVMLKTEDGITSEDQIHRDNLKSTQTPQTFYINEIVANHHKADELGIKDSIASSALYIDLGEKLHLVNGSEKNIKITTTEDVEIFTALLDAKKPSWMREGR